MLYVLLMFILALMTFIGSDWFNAAVAIQVALLVTLIVSGVIILNCIVEERKKS